jgi:hypothetical protein
MLGFPEILRMWRARRRVRRIFDEQRHYLTRIEERGVHPRGIVKDVLRAIVASEHAIARAGAHERAHAWLDAVLVELRRELDDWRVREDDVDGYGSATIQEVMRGVAGVVHEESERSPLGPRNSDGTTT